MYFPCMSFFQFKMILNDFLAISIWNVFVKLIIISVVKSISFGSKIPSTLYLNVSFITSCRVQAGGHRHLLKRVLGSDTF